MEEIRGGFRIVVVGDDGVGKTSIIQALASSSVPDAVPPVIERPVLFPPSKSSFSLPTPSHVIDTPSPNASTPSSTSTGSSISTSNPWENMQIPQEIASRIRVAHVVCVICDASRQETWEGVESHWLPALRKSNPSIPIVVVANKVDLIQADNPDLAEWFRGLLERNRDVESCTTCSARQSLYIGDVFDLAQRAILFPMGPLYDSSTGKMTDTCLASLSRVFKLLDKDCDNALNDEELDHFQRISLGSSLNNHQQFPQQQQQQSTSESQTNIVKQLSSEQLIAIKEKVRKETPNGIDELGRITLQGFIYLNHRLCQRARAECTWRVLYAFGYDTSLKLRESILNPRLEHINLHNNNNHHATSYKYELSPAGIGFLADVFQRHDIDSDGILNQQELNTVFSTCITMNTETPFFNSLDTKNNNNNNNNNNNSNNVEHEINWVTLGWWINRWRVICLEDPKAVLRLISQLGYEGDPHESLILSRGPLNSNRQSQSRGGEEEEEEIRCIIDKRTVWMCYVFGSRGCGTTSILKSLSGKSFNRTNEYTPTTNDESAFGSIVEINQSTSTSQANLLVAKIFGSGDDDTVHDTEKMSHCDAIILAHDSHNPISFAHALRLHEFLLSRYPEIPVVHCATKSDLPAVKQIAKKSPDTFLRSLGLPNSIAVSAKDNKNTSLLFRTAVNAACNPKSYQPNRSWSAGNIVRTVTTSTAGLKPWQKTMIFSAALTIALSGSTAIALIVRRWRQYRPLLPPSWISWMFHFFPFLNNH